MHLLFHHHRHHHHHVREGLGVFPIPYSSRWSWSLHLFLGRPFGLYWSACFGVPFVSILCTCCSHFFWYILFPLLCSVSQFFPQYIDYFLHPILLFPVSVSNFTYAASKRCSSLFFSTQASLPNFNAALAVMLWILNFVSLFICFPKCFRIAPFILLYVCNLSLNHFCILIHGTPSI